jgi:tRNA(Ile)-lysidine synthase
MYFCFMQENWINHFFQQHPYLQGKRFLLGLSGGKDSMTLLVMLVKSGVYVEAAHCNFSLRGEESDGDELFVRNYCEQLGVKLHVKSFDTKKEAAQRGESIQAVARELRYSWFNQLLDTEGLDYIFTAHHLNDSVETFFINLARGSGINGLTGIPMQNQQILRPLLGVKASEIIEYVRVNSIPFREDSSNKNNKYRRNFVRNSIIPEMEANFPGFLENVIKTMDYLGDVKAICEQSMAQFRNEVVKEEQGEILIDRAKMEKFQPLRYYLHELLSPFGFSSDNIEKVANAPSGKIFEGEGATLFVDRDWLKMTISQEKEIELNPLQVDLSTHFLPTPLGNFTFEHFDEKVKYSTNSNECFLDAKKLRFPLQLRFWCEGDSFVPLGMKGKKKLSDFFVDEKVSVQDKKKIWLLCNADGEIMWVVGRRMSEEFKLTNKTSSVIKVTFDTQQENSPK